jgi:predicted metal-dependent hydrolase
MTSEPEPIRQLAPIARLERPTQLRLATTVEPTTVQPTMSVEPTTVEPTAVEPTMTVEATKVEPTTVEPTTVELTQHTPKVEVVRSRRRRKTVSARQVGDVVRVSVPATMTRAEEERWVTEMVRRINRRQHAAAVDLEERARVLARRFALAVPKSTRWVDNQLQRWGSCTPSDGTVRISSRLASEPPWVLDYVIVHELAHLQVSGHSKAFWDIVARYPLAERARGFLIARGGDGSEDGPGDDPLDDV